MDAQDKNYVWDSRLKPFDASELAGAVAGFAPLIQSLRSFGLPLDESGTIVCLIELVEDNIHGLVATPSGLAYRFEPAEFEQDFWAFAASHYYIVTGNMADRKAFAETVNVDASTIKGKCLSKNKTEPPSKMTIDDNLAVISKANFIEPEQACLGFSFPS